MGTKTYVSSSMSNLNGTGMEYKYNNLSVLEGAMAIGQHVMQGFHLQETQLGGQGTGFRNWIYWARNYKFSSYHEPEIDEDKTYNEMFHFYEPQITATPEIAEEDATAFIEANFNFSSEPEEIPLETLKLVGKTPDGEFKEVTVMAPCRKVRKYKLIDSYQGAYSQEKLGEAFIWLKYEEYLKDSEWIKRYIASDSTQKAYRIVAGDNLAESNDDESETIVEGNMDDIWLQLGYSFTEPHVDEETNEDVSLEVFNAEENIYIKLKEEIGKIVPNYNNKTLFFALWGYFYDSYELDANTYSIKDGVLELDAGGSPVKKEPEEPTKPDEEEPKPSWATVKFYYESSYEDWEKTVEEKWASPADLEEEPSSIEGFAYIDTAVNVSNDPNLGHIIDKDLANVDAKLCPIVCFRHDKGWIATSEGHWTYAWYLRFVKACKKLNQDETYYDTLYKELKEQITQGDVAWVYLIYGLPTNYVQTHYGCHYALQFFKQLMIPNWDSYKPGDTVEVRGKGFSYTYGYRAFNCNFRFSANGATYRCGTGKCPYATGSDVRRGSLGVTGEGVFWRQWDTNAWEAIAVWGYGTSFKNIKNGESGWIGGASWTAPIWEEEDVKRNFSKCIIPLMWEVGQNIPYTDWTNMMQFCANVGATAYKVVKTKWYQTALFKIILIIVIIIIVIIVSYFSCGTLSGPAAKAGAAIAGTVGGSTAFWTAVVSVAISVAVAVAVNAIVTPILKEVFGEVVGSILGAIVSIVVNFYIGGGNLNFTDIMTEFMNPMNWIQIANAAINGMAELVQKKLGELRQEIHNFVEAVEDKYAELYTAMAALGQKNDYLIGKVQHGATYGNALDQCVVETADSFCKRCIDSCVNATENAHYTLEHQCELVINNQTQPCLLLADSSSSSNALGQTV